MAHYDFLPDLALSELAVAKVITLLEKKGAVNIITNNDHRYDIGFELDEKTFTVEVKEDRMYHFTGNVAIEWQSRNKLSGISTSEATHWCYVLDRGCGYDGIYFIKKRKLRQYLKDHLPPQTDGGDQQTSRLFLLPLTTFITLFDKKG